MKILLMLIAPMIFVTILSFHIPDGFESDQHHSIIKRGDLPNGFNDLFAGSGECLMCHNTMTNEAGELISIVGDWRSSMMAHSAKDPFWQAKVSHETLVNPQLKNEIETVCTRCHAPMGNVNAHHMGQEFYTMEEMKADPLALDGVSCTVCHQIPATSLGNFSGTFEIGTDKEIWGPYENPFVNPMINHTGYTPVHSNHIKDSRVCASCHTLLTASLDMEGNPTGEEFVEQAIYQEWLNSSYPQYGTACQSCHIPEIDDVVKISSMPPGLAGRTPFGMHHLAGANVFMLKLIKENLTTLGITATATQMDSTIARAERMLQQSSIFMEVQEINRTEDTLYLDIVLMNLAGHKFPSGYPSRRAFLQTIVINENNDTLFFSGQTDDSYNLIHEDAGFENHHQQIINEEQVQIYEMVMGNVNYEPTTVLERAYVHLKDNRIPPHGFNDTHSTYDTVAVIGDALLDEDFNKMNNEQGTGADIVHFQVPINGDTGDLQIISTLYYQSVTDKWLEHMFSFSSEEIDLFKDLYNNADKTPVKVSEHQFTSFSTSIKEHQNPISIFPNPTKGNLYFKSAFQIEEIKIYTLDGKLLSQYQSLPENSPIVFELSTNLPSGMYLIAIQKQNQITQVEKIIIAD